MPTTPPPNPPASDSAVPLPPTAALLHAPASSAFCAMDEATRRTLDRITGLAVRLLATPVAVVSIADGGTEWICASVGEASLTRPRELGICPTVIGLGTTLAITDLREDARFAKLPQVTEHGMRAFLGAPVRDSTGRVLAGLCVKDTRVRSWTSAEMATLVELAHLTGRELELLAAKGELDRARQRLELAKNVARMGVWEWDIARDKLVWDDQLFDLYGVSRGSFAGTFRDWTTGVLPEDVESVTQHVEECLRTDEDLRTEYRVQHPTRGVRVLSVAARVLRGADGKPDRMVGVNADVTHERRAMEALRKRDGILRSVGEMAQIGSWELDAQTRVLSWSEEVALIFGLPTQPAPSVGEMVECFASNVRTVLADALDRCLRSGEGFDLELPLRRADGSEVWTRVIGFAHQQMGKVQAVHGLLQDISAHRSTDAKLLAAQQLADVANRAKSDFLAHMSHEIRTPITAIMGFADLLLDPDTTPAERVAHTQTIRRNSAHLLDLINDVLDLSKIESGKLALFVEPTDPARIAREVTESMQLQARSKGVLLTLRVEPAVPPLIQCDPMRLRQVLTNLVSNAVKFTDAGSVRVHMDVEPSANDPSTPSTLRVEVMDTGVGIRTEALGQLFQPFQQADDTMSRRFGGTGLGLAISARLATMLEGSIRVSSTPGVGSSFVLRVPAHPVRTDASTPPEAQAGTPQRPELAPPLASGHPPLRGVRVLLAEDGPDNQRLICLLLRKAGAEVQLVENGVQAVHTMLSQPPGSIDAVLMDMQMPEMDGYEATRRLRAAGAYTPIIALTAHAMSTDRARCLAAGCTDYLAKPVERDVLVKKVAEHALANTQRGLARQGPAVA